MRVTQCCGNVTGAQGIALCIFLWPAADLLSDDKLLGYLSSLQNSFRLPTLIPPPVPQGAFFPPLPGMSHFYDCHFGPPSARASHALNPAHRVNLPALIKMASFVMRFLPTSLVPNDNGHGNFFCRAGSKALTLRKVKVRGTILS